jgi:hypothetical protein
MLNSSEILKVANLPASKWYILKGFLPLVSGCFLFMPQRYKEYLFKSIEIFFIKIVGN